ncbi:hypothetical protein [Halorubrum saccharovorum]|uniref:hypothetical protein n=1 Tax=Halorubrum saccharovorum TaxID=2248 RepID=UPI001268ECCF|nr:hypothetical protein [Halorubrum saccharovorum]
MLIPEQVTVNLFDIFSTQKYGLIIGIALGMIIKFVFKIVRNILEKVITTIAEETILNRFRIKRRRNNWLQSIQDDAESALTELERDANNGIPESADNQITNLIGKTPPSDVDRDEVGDVVNRLKLLQQCYIMVQEEIPTVDRKEALRKHLHKLQLESKESRKSGILSRFSRVNGII